MKHILYVFFEKNIFFFLFAKKNFSFEPLVSYNGPMAMYQSYSLECIAYCQMD